jgi:4-amino-4-deoxy-L-arabinose transferase-like glycosyltransferase
MHHLLRVLLAASVFFILSTFELFTPGQFMDGATYASISRNLSQGIGSYWELFYTPYLYPNFIEHPPFFFWIQSLFFKVIGDKWYTEDIMGVLLWAITALGIEKIGKWSNLSNRGIQWALIFWAIIPIVCWSYGNNLLETLVSPLTVWSVALASYGIQKKHQSLIFISGFLISFAFLTKGPVGLFPLSFPFFWHITSDSNRKFRLIIIHSFQILLGTLIAISILLAFESSNAYLHAYWSKQVINSISKIATVDNRLYIVGSYLTQLILPFLIALTIHVFNKGSRWKGKTISKSLTFGLFSLSAVIPMIISLKQSDFYSVPAFPFAAISMAFWIEKELINLHDFRTQSKLLVIIICLITGIGFRALPIVKNHRDFILRESIEHLSRNHEGEIMKVDSVLFKNWNLHAQCARYGPIYLVENKENSELIRQKNGGLKLIK